MFMMRFQQNIGFCGCNPFMSGICNPFAFGGYNPRMNFFLGMAAQTAAMQTSYTPMFPAMPIYTQNVFNPYMTLASTNPYSMGGFGSYSYRAPSVFNYTPQATFSTLPQTTTPTSQQTTTQGAVTPAKPSKDNSSADTRSYETGHYTPSCGSVKSKAFLNKVKEIARRLNCNYKDLLGLMQSESGLNPQAVNKSSGATGLIQFMPATAKALGTTTSALKNMTALQQLDYVEKYLQQMKRQAGFGQMQPLSGGQLYALVFLPARSGREVLTSQGEKYYSANKGLDKNKDGKITKSELDARVRSFYVNENCFVA